MDPFLSIDHVQLAMPEGGEAMARAFFVELLEMNEVPKPVELAKRGGCWFESGAVRIHLGVQSTEFKPATKAHPALICNEFDELVHTLQENGVQVKFDDADQGDGRRHAYVSDPFGNRIELVSD